MPYLCHSGSNHTALQEQQETAMSFRPDAINQADLCILKLSTNDRLSLKNVKQADAFLPTASRTQK
jgi:hypothetical protein